MTTATQTKALAVSLVLQTDSKECGAACLAMILQAHGVSASLNDCRSCLAIEKRGTNASALLGAARSFGVEARAFSIADRENLGLLTLPAILHWQNKHFVVLIGIQGQRLHMLDPAEGRRTVSWREFRRHFSGTALAFENPRAVQSGRDGALPVRSLASTVKGLLHRREVVALSLGLVAATLVLFVMNMAMPLIGDSWLKSTDSARHTTLVGVELLRLEAFSFIVGAVALALVMVHHVRALHLDFFEARLTRLLKSPGLLQVVGAPTSISRFMQEPTGEPTLPRSATRVRRRLARCLSAWVTDGVSVALAFAALLIIHPEISLVAATAIGLHLPLILGSRSSHRRALLSELDSGHDVSSRLLDLDRMLHADPQRWPQTLSLTIVALAMVASGLAAGSAILLQTLSLGGMVTAMVLMYLCLWPLQAWVSTWRLLAGVPARLDALEMALTQSALDNLLPRSASDG